MSDEGRVMTTPARLVLAAIVCGVGIAASFALARYDPTSSCPTASQGKTPTQKATSGFPANPLGDLLGGRNSAPCVRYRLGTPGWAVVAAFVAPIVGGTIFGLVAMSALAPTFRRRWRSQRLSWSGRIRQRSVRLGRGGRVFLAALMAGVAMAGAVATAAWQLPVAVLIGFVGIGASGAFLVSGRSGRGM